MMRDAGFDFDDEIFGATTCREIRIEQVYEPKQCDSEWFMKFHVKDETERQIIKKYQGDLFFQKHQYSEALSVYQESLQCLTSNNTVLEWELTESMALCLLKQDKPDDALSLVRGMMHVNQENESSYWYLLYQIYRAMGNIEGEIETLQRCATLHSWNAQFWFSLALAYEKASVSCSNLCQDEDVTKVERERISFKKHNPAIENCTKRFFLEKSIESSSSFAKEKSSILLREVNSRIAGHAECGCAHLIEKVLEMLYSSVAASGQTQLDQEQSETKLKESRSETMSTESVTNSYVFEQKWFSDLLSYMDAI